MVFVVGVERGASGIVDPGLAVIELGQIEIIEIVAGVAADHEATVIGLGDLVHALLLAHVGVRARTGHAGVGIELGLPDQVPGFRVQFGHIGVRVPVVIQTCGVVPAFRVRGTVVIPIHPGCLILRCIRQIRIRKPESAVEASFLGGAEVVPTDRQGR